MDTNTTNAACASLSGPNCTYGPDYWPGQCQKEFPHFRRGDPVTCGAWAQCVLTSLSQYEQSILAQRQYILTLWPAFIGFICAFGPDAGDIVYDNVWWSILFAVTCAGVPGMDSRRPRHIMNVDWIEEGHRICESAPHAITARYPELIPRSYGRPSTKQVEAVVRIEWASWLFSLLLWIGFSGALVYALSLACTYSVKIAAGAGIWYWMSILPGLLSVISEALQNRTDLYEQCESNEYTSHTPNTASTDVHSPLRDISKTAGTSVDINGNASNTAPLYRRTYPRSFLHLWTRIIYLQWTRQRYRLLVRPEDDRWYFLIFKLVIGLSRIYVFAWGSTVMGGVVLFPMPLDLAMAVLLCFLTAIPRMTFFGVWRNKARGADILVICNELAIGQHQVLRRHSFGTSVVAGNDGVGVLVS